MDVYWIDFDDTTNGTSFWCHEWSKHGTCAMSDSLLSTEHAFFAAALQLNAKYNITQALDSANIYPGGNYRVTDMQTAVANAYGGNCVFQCSGSDITQVVMCISPQLVAMTCPTAVYNSLMSEGGCSGTIDYKKIYH